MCWQNCAPLKSSTDLKGDLEPSNHVTLVGLILRSNILLSQYHGTYSHFERIDGIADKYDTFPRQLLHDVSTDNLLTRKAGQHEKLSKSVLGMKWREGY